MNPHFSAPNFCICGSERKSPYFKVCRNTSYCRNTNYFCNILFCKENKNTKGKLCNYHEKLYLFYLKSRDYPKHNLKYLKSFAEDCYFLAWKERELVQYKKWNNKPLIIQQEWELVPFTAKEVEKQESENTITKALRTVSTAKKIPSLEAAYIMLGLIFAVALFVTLYLIGYKND